MKLKYYLRGLGTGIIFSTIIMLAAYLTSGGYKLTDKEIESRAKDLGMVYEDATGGDARSSDNTVTSEMKESPEATEKATTEGKTEDSTESATELTTEHITTEGNYDRTESDIVDNESTQAVITVVGGMGSHDVALLLQDAGLIADADDFDSYLNQNGYSTRIEVGEFTINDDMTYQEMAELLCTKK